MIRLAVVLDEWADPEPPPLPLPRLEFSVRSGDSIRQQWKLDAMLAASIQMPGPLILVTGI